MSFDVVGRTPLMLALVLLTSACPDDPREQAMRETVARVGDRFVTRGRMLAELTWSGVARSESKETRRALARELLDRVVESEVFLVAAQRKGITIDVDDVTREVRRAADGYPPGTFERMLIAEQMTPALFEERVRRRMTIDAFLRAELDPGRPIAESDIAARYEARRDDAMRPEQVLARQILVKTEEEAAHILRELRAKRTTFEDAARRFSDAPERDDGGRLGWYARGELPDVFDVAFVLSPGQITDVIASQYGFHIFELLEKREKGIDSLEAATPRIEAELRREREERETAALLTRLKGQIPVLIDERALAEVVESLPKAPSLTERGPDPAPNTAQLASPAGTLPSTDTPAPAPPTLEKGTTP